MVNLTSGPLSTKDRLPKLQFLRVSKIFLIVFNFLVVLGCSKLVGTIETKFIARRGLRGGVRPEGLVCGVSA
jgi:hypothetical protein